VELYARVSPNPRGMFRYCVTLWKSEDGIESVWLARKFFRCTSSIKWAQIKIIKHGMKSGSTILIREKDIIRRSWND